MLSKQLQTLQALQRRNQILEVRRGSGGLTVQAEQGRASLREGCGSVRKQGVLDSHGPCIMLVGMLHAARCTRMAGPAPSRPISPLLQQSPPKTPALAAAGHERRAAGAAAAAGEGGGAAEACAGFSGGAQPQPATQPVQVGAASARGWVMRHQSWSLGKLANPLPVHCIA